MTEERKLQLDDFRDIRGYYELIFEVMRSLTKHFSDNNYQGIVNNLRHLAMNAAPYLKDFMSVLAQIEQEYAKLFDEKFQRGGKLLRPSEMPKELKEEYYKAQDEFRQFARQLSGLIYIQLSQSGVLPRSKKIKVEEISVKFKGVVG